MIFCGSGKANLPRHCERSEQIHLSASKKVGGLLCRYAPRNDEFRPLIMISTAAINSTPMQP